MRGVGLALVILGYLVAVGIGLVGGLTMLSYQGAVGIDAYVMAVYGSAIGGCLVVGLAFVIVGRRIRRRHSESPELRV